MRYGSIACRHDRDSHITTPPPQTSFSCGGGVGSNSNLGVAGSLSQLSCVNQKSIQDSPERRKLSSSISQIRAVSVYQHQLQQLLSRDSSLNNIHPSQPPFLGSTYWVAATPPSSKSVHLNKSIIGVGLKHESGKQQHLLSTPKEDCLDDNYPSLITPSTIDENSPMKSATEVDCTRAAHFPSLHTRREDDGEEEKEKALLTRRLFSDEAGASCCKQSQISYTQMTEDVATSSSSCILNCIPQSQPSRVDLTPPPPSPSCDNHRHNNRCDSPNVTTFKGLGFQSRERYITTSPSQKDPIRLRITEQSTSYNFQSHPSTSFEVYSNRGFRANPTGVVGDSYSYDPYILNSSYNITQNGRPYGNGLHIKSCSGVMTLEDVSGNVLAVMKSIYATDSPRRIVYAPKQRYRGQLCSGFRLRSLGRDDLNKKERTMVVEGNEGIQLYPWVMVKKESSTLYSPCSVHYFVEENKGGSFQSSPAFVGRHGFDGGAHTHTIVSRIIDSGCGDGGEGKRTRSRRTSTPCCAIVRDPVNIDAVEMVISPGIDPLLMICYITIHTKMDIEAFSSFAPPPPLMSHKST